MLKWVNIRRLTAAVLVWAAGCRPAVRMNPVSGPPDWENERVFECNRLAARATFTPYPTEAMALCCEPEESPYRMSLNGPWKFRWSPRPEVRPSEFFRPEYNMESWDTIKVPSNWQMEGYGVQIYTSSPHPFRVDPPRVMGEPEKDWTASVNRNPVGSYRRTPEKGGFTHWITWTLRGDGSIESVHRFEPFGQLPSLLRIGVVMQAAGTCDRVTWYGLGPHENYIDRKEAARMGLWSMTVEAMFVPYPQPQETGLRTDVRWLSLTDASGRGLLAAAREPIAFSVRRYTVEDLDRARHPYELTARNVVILSLDARHSGLGNGSCGPGVLPEYEVKPEPVELTLRFYPAG